MSCCGKAKNVIKKTANIVTGYSRLVRGVRCRDTDDRIRTCQWCEKNYWIKRTLWCSICKCYIPAKARVEDEDCPLGKWNFERSMPENKESLTAV